MKTMIMTLCLFVILGCGGIMEDECPEECAIGEICFYGTCVPDTDATDSDASDPPDDVEADTETGADGDADGDTDVREDVTGETVEADAEATDSDADADGDDTGGDADADGDEIDDGVEADAADGDADGDGDADADDGGAEIVDFPGPCLAEEGFEGGDPGWSTPETTWVTDVARTGTHSIRFNPLADGTMGYTPAQFGSFGMHPPFVIEFYWYWPGDLTEEEFALLLLSGGAVGHAGALGLQITATGAHSVFWWYHDPMRTPIASWSEATWAKVDVVVRCDGDLEHDYVYVDGVLVIDRPDSGGATPCPLSTSTGVGSFGSLFRPIYADDFCLKNWTEG